MYPVPATVTLIEVTMPAVIEDVADALKLDAVLTGFPIVTDGAPV